MNARNPSVLLRYSFSLLVVALAVVTRILLNPVLGDTIPFVTLFLAVTLASWYGGFGPGVVAAVAGAVAAAAFIMPPAYAPVIRDTEHQISLLVYLIVSLPTALLGGAIHKAYMREALNAAEAIRQKEEVRTTLESIGDAVIATDVHGRVVTMNPVAEALTGWKGNDARGRPLEDIFHIVDEKTRRPCENPASRVIRDGTVVGVANHTLLIAKDGAERPIDDSAAPIRDAEGRLTGVVLVFRDVTERRGTEEAIQRLAAIVECSHEAILSKTLDGTITSWNGAAERLYGYSASEAVGQSVSMLVPAARKEELAAIVNNLREGRKVDHFETVRVTKDGREVDVEVSISPIRSHYGEIIGASTIARDISARRRQEEERKRLESELLSQVEALREAENRIRSVLHNVLDGIITIDAKGTVTSFNPAAERLFGYSADEVVGRNVKLLMPEPYHSEHDGYIESYKRTGEARIIGTGREVRGKRKDGSTFPMDLAVSEFHFRDGRYFTGIVRDITERKRAEESLRFVAEAASAFSAVVDYESTLQTVAGMAVPRFADWCAIDLADDDGQLRRLAVAHVDPARVQHAYELDRRYPPDPNARVGRYNIMRTGLSEMIAEVPDELVVASAKSADHLRLARELGVRSYIGVPLKRRGRTLGVITFVTADSNRLYTDRDMALAEDLAGRAAIAIDNAELYRELKKSDQLKTEFLAMLAHELRNPLAPIRNALQILRVPEAGPDAIAKAREIAERQVHHLTRLVDDLVDVSRIMRGVIELRTEPLDLKAVVDRAIETAQPSVDAGSHDLDIRIPDGPLYVHGDMVRLSQVLANLLNNAAKYTPPGGQIRLEVDRLDPFVLIRISDTGIGITPEMLPQIFDLFVQVDHSAVESHGGMGIGLTLVKRLVEMHGGAVSARSGGLGHGSEFAVKLPLDVSGGVPAPAIPEREPDTAGAALPGRRVVVVDDNVDAAESVAMLLRLEGHDVRVGYDGPTGLELARSHRPEFVFLDIGMPRMDGLEVARRLRQNPSTRHVVLVAVTGWGQEEDRRRTRAAGFDFHMVKPVEPDALRTMLRSVDQLLSPTETGEDSLERRFT